MQIVEGDLIAMGAQGDFDVIVHGCNCFHTMGAGIAKFIASEFPEALSADRGTSKGDKAKLGTVSIATVQRGTHHLSIVNAYTQFHWRGRGRKVDYDALQSAFEEVRKNFSGARIGYPMIGAGLAGGNWQVIAPRIDLALEGCDHTLVILPGTQI
ncbi:MAG: macro domain-containing protein [Pseudomonadota bacterium]